MLSKSDVQKWAIEILDRPDNYGTAEYNVACYALWKTFDPGQREVFNQLLFHGPVYDGDVCSKVARDSLFPLGLAVRCCFKGEQGYTAASYRAYSVWQRTGETSSKALG